MAKILKKNSVTIKKENKENKLTKTEKNKFAKSYNMISRHITYLKSWRLAKRSKYIKDIKKLVEDINMIFDSKYSTLNDIKKIYNQLFSCNYFIKYQRLYEEEELKKLNVDNADNALNQDELGDLQDNMYDEILKKCNDEVSTIIVNFLKKIKDKFNEIPEQILVSTFDNYNTSGYELKICEYLREINYKIKTKKLLEIFMKKISCNYYDLIDFDNIEFSEDSINKSLFSFQRNNFKDLDKFFNNIKDLNKDRIGDELIKFLINDKHLYDDNNINGLENIFEFVLKNLDIKYILQILQCVPLLLFSEDKYNGRFYRLYNDNGEEVDDVETDKNICNVISTLSKKIEDTVKLYYEKIVSVYAENIKITIKDFDDLDIIISQTLHNNCFPIIFDKPFKTNRIRRYRQIRKSNIIAENNIKDDMYYYVKLGDINISGKTIKMLYKTIRLPVLNILTKKIIKEKNITELIDINLFKNDSTILNLEEKINLFETIFNGKITNKNLVDMIFNNNELALYIVNNINATDDMIKSAFKSSNVCFISKLIDMKYNMKTSYLNYILENKNIEEILRTINKYNTLEFDDESDWIVHITYLNNSIDIGKCFYNEYNEDMINKMNQTIENVKKTPNLMMLNNLEFKEFVEQVNKYINTYKLKIKINDIIKLKDFNKRQYLISLLSLMNQTSL